MTTRFEFLAVYTLLAIPFTCYAIWKCREDYRRRGRLTWFGLLVLNLAFLMPHLALDAAIVYRWPATGAGYAGAGLIVAGLALCAWALAAFRSARKVFCLDAGKLTLTGPYRWSRNPQYVGWGTVFLGFALVGWTWWCLWALAMFAVVVHIIVRIEEEHLARIFGDRYRTFLASTPRYLGHSSA